MKSPFLILALLLFLNSCSNPNKREQPREGLREKDTLTTPLSHADSTESNESKPVRSDASTGLEKQPAAPQTRIDYVKDFYFLDNNEVYVELYFKKDSTSYTYFNKVADLADSVIYEDDENRRTRIPIETARRHFVLEGLQSIYIFNENHELLGQTELKRVEYLNQNISPCFIAVYDLKKPLGKTKAYCIGNAIPDFDAIQYVQFQDDGLTEQLAEQFSIDQKYTPKELKGLHYREAKSGQQFSIVNYYPACLIVKKENDDYRICYKGVDENIASALMLPIIVNNMPLILTKSYMPDSDFLWNGLLLFDEDKYHSSDMNLVNLQNATKD